MIPFCEIKQGICVIRYYFSFKNMVLEEVLLSVLFSSVNDGGDLKTSLQGKNMT